jgi:hypothetical protein
MASNMGFKLNYLLQKQDAGVSNSGQNTLALPYNQQTSLVDASDLFADINATVANSAVSVSKLVRALDTLDTYDGSSPLEDFALVSGEGLKIQVQNSDVPYIAVGSHKPGLVIGLVAKADNISATGQNYFAFPYHGTAATAADLTGEIEGFVAGSVVSISKVVRALDTLDTYDGGSPLEDFSLNPGTMYIIQVTTDVPYVPQHY